MRRLIVIALLVAAGRAVADPEPLSSFLERRIPEELAAEGTVLSRQGLALKIDQIEDRLVVSIVDVATGRVAASTLVEGVPADPEAAVAMVTHVAADLVAQIAGRAVVAPVQTVVVDDREERRRHEVAELEFKRKSLRFGHQYESWMTDTSGLHRWIAYQGELDEQLDAETFYSALGRPDLLDAYHHRRHVELGALAVSGVAFAGTIALIVKALTIEPGNDCASASQFSACYDERTHDRDRLAYPALALTGVSLVALTVGVYYAFNPHPISQAEAKMLADQYNQHLRRELGLPFAAQREPRLHDVRIVPYATGSGAGLVLGARF